MTAIRKIIENPSNPLTINIPEEYQNRKIEVTILPLEDETLNDFKRYDFSDLAGKLEWKGDALAEQKKLRDEWK